LNSQKALGTNYFDPLPSRTEGINMEE